MGKKTLGLLFVLVTGSISFGAGFVGAPVSTLNRDQFSIEFAYSRLSIDPGSSSFSRQREEYLNGILQDMFSLSDRISVKQKDFDVIRYYGVVNYGLTDSWEFNLRFGISDVSMSEQEAGGWLEHSFDNDLTGGIGTRYTFSKQDNVEWGVTLQMNWMNSRSSQTVSVVEDFSQIHTAYDVKLRGFDILLAAGPAVDMGKWSVYGGPLYHYFSGSYKQSRSETTTFGPFTRVVNDSLKGDITFHALGGFFGVIIDFADNAVFNTELSATDQGWGFGAGIVYRY